MLLRRGKNNPSSEGKDYGIWRECASEVRGVDLGESGKGLVEPYLARAFVRISRRIYCRVHHCVHINDAPSRSEHDFHRESDYRGDRRGPDRHLCDEDSIKKTIF